MTSLDSEKINYYNNQSGIACGLEEQNEIKRWADTLEHLNHFVDD